ncbi:MAG: TIGR00300 family protein [Nitrosarchaeum sp.]|nr:TIGR00300 family protein [Nitrosarchaeum sp.]PHY09098.1 MAG: TIGR00300 family protein [Nitrosarchaeum sp.]
MAKFSQEIEVSGHLIDSSILTKIFDKIMDLHGEFQVEEINIGKQKKDASYARLSVTGKNQKHLDEILETIYREGAVSKTQKRISLKKSPKDMVMPINFYSTTNNHTQIFYNEKWIPVENMMMDKCIVVKNGKASCVPVRDVRKGDEIIVGEGGIKITPPERPREGVNVFEFMGSSTSSERPTQHIAKKVAEDIYKTKKAGGRIIIVGGPAIIHTGASDAVAELIKLGFIDGLLAGNALAVHDIEYATMGTSLGMNVHDASLAYRGHRNHMDAINAVFTAGSIPNMVKTKKLTRGILYQCIKNKIPYVLAGSIRDDGPLPDVITDVTVAQREYKKILKNANMVIMISTMLHSIATGNMLPANVKVIVIDINQPTVTKLMDRGTWQALGIVTDVGAFLPLVAQEIKKYK